MPKRIYRSYGITDDVYAKAQARLLKENKGKVYEDRNSISRIAAVAVINYAYPNKETNK